MTKRHGAGENDQRYRAMTVANVREREGADHVEVMFLESARFFRLLRSNPAYHETMRLLREAAKAGHVLKVRCPSLDSDLIEEIRE